MRIGDKNISIDKRLSQKLDLLVERVKRRKLDNVILTY